MNMERVRGYDNHVLLREWQETAKADPLRPENTPPDGWLRLNGLGKYTKGIAEKRPDQWTKTP
jgi:hypothetical protein